MARIKGTDDIVIKKRFADRYKLLLKERYDEFIEYSLSYQRRSFRVNTLKSSVSEIKKRLKTEWELTQIPWCREGFWITGKRRDVGNLVEHSLGYIYVQEAASMIPPIVLNPKPGEHVLDLCAAPGSKSSQIVAMMENNGVLVCNDYKGSRLRPLGLNLQRAGVTNSIITLMKGQNFKDLKFDKILVDAPCSGTGTIRKSLKTLTMWNPDVVKRLSLVQKNLIETGINMLKEDGTLVYSTCSQEPHENEAVIDFLLNKFDVRLEEIKIDLNRSKPILEFDGDEYDSEVKKSLRIWPQDNDTEGFFVAKIKKA